MASFGANFDFRIPPKAAARGSQWLSPSTATAGTQSAGGGTIAFSSGNLTFPGGLLPIGAPVVWDSSGGPNGNGKDPYGRLYVKLAGVGVTTANAGLYGVLVYQYGPAAYAGYDPYLTVYSDLGFVPMNQGVIVVHGDPATKMVLRNTTATSFLGLQGYPARTMIAGIGATPDITVGDYLIPGNGNDIDGYWESTATAAGAWAQITWVDSTRAEVTAQLLF
jgi:hypothetical protein